MDTPNVDSQNLDGAGGTPSQPVSPGGDGSIKDAEQLSQLLDKKLSDALKPVLSEFRGLQGRQDKDRTTFREFLDEYNKHKASGLSDLDAESAAEHSLKEKSEAERDKNLLRQIAEKVLGSSAIGSGAPAQATIDLTQYKLDANDPEVVASVLSQTDPKDAEIAALRLAHKRATQPPPSPSGASTITGTPQTIPDMASKVTKLAELQKLPTKNKAEIEKLEKELGWR